MTVVKIQYDLNQDPVNHIGYGAIRGRAVKFSFWHLRIIYQVLSCGRLVRGSQKNLQVRVFGHRNSRSKSTKEINDLILPFGIN